LFTNNRDKAVKLNQKRVYFLSELENQESRWLDASELYEVAVKEM